MPTLNLSGAGEQGSQRALPNSFPGMLLVCNRSPEALSLAIIVSEAQIIPFEEQGGSKDACAKAKVRVNRNAGLGRKGSSNSLHKHAGSKYEGDARNTASKHFGEKRATPVHDRSVGCNKGKCVSIPRKGNREVSHKSNMHRKPNAEVEDANHTLETGSTLRSNSKQGASNKESNANVREGDTRRLSIKVNSTFEAWFSRAILVNKVFLTKRTAYDDADKSQSSKKLSLIDAPQYKESPLHKLVVASGKI